MSDRSRLGACHALRPRLAAILLMCGALAGCAPSAPVVKHYGVMREVMREGRTEPRVALSAVVARPHAYGVGAVEGLAGEITIDDGVVWVASVVDGSLHVTQKKDRVSGLATLLTFSHVESWREAPLQRAADGADLEAIIESTARSMGIDTTRPFPILLEGDAISLELHVINGYCPHAVDPATINAQPWSWSSDQPGPARLVGFYAADAEGVMTHHGSSMHLHALVRDGERTITGHVDRVEVGAGAVLRVPAP